MSSLNGKIAVVTGGTSGIGLATAKELSARGVKVILTGRKKIEVEKIALDLNGQVLFAIRPIWPILINW